MNEFAPGWSKPRMTKSQVKKYIQDQEEKRKKAKKALEEAEENWDLYVPENELKNIEDELNKLL
jgi:hypothetical protein